MAVKDEWDDVADLTQSEMSNVGEWKEQFEERYDYVGRLVRSKDEIIETVEDDVAAAAAVVPASNDNLAISSQKDQNNQNKTKQSQPQSESSNDSDLEVINPDQVEQK